MSAAPEDLEALSTSEIAWVFFHQFCGSGPYKSCGRECSPETLVGEIRLFINRVQGNARREVLDHPEKFR